MKAFALTIFAALAAGIALADEPPMSASTHTTGAASQPLGEARILASKFLLSSYAVADKELIIDYRLYNVGDKVATKVTLDDSHSFNTEYFDIERGSLHVVIPDTYFKAKWERIGPGANVTHSVSIKPKQAGQFNYTSAIITYIASEDSDAPKTAYSSAPGEGYIYFLKDYERKFSPHFLDWVIFALMALPCLALPASLWYKSAQKYTITDSKKKNN